MVCMVQHYNTTVKPPIKDIPDIPDIPKEDKPPTKDKPKVLLYTHSIENHL